MSDREVTARDVLEVVAACILAVAAIVAVYALIWSAWPTFRVAVTVIFSVAVLATAAEYVADKINRK